MHGTASWPYSAHGRHLPWFLCYSTHGSRQPTQVNLGFCQLGPTYFQRMYARHLRHSCGVKFATPNAMLLAELGLLPLQVFWWQQTWKSQGPVMFSRYDQVSLTHRLVGWQKRVTNSSSSRSATAGVALRDIRSHFPCLNWFCSCFQLLSPFDVKTPFSGRFDQLGDQALTAGSNKVQPVAEACISAERFSDFYKGCSRCCWCCCYCFAKFADSGYCCQGDVSEETPRTVWPRREVKQANSLKRTHNNSLPFQETYTCIFGPEDYRSGFPEALTQKERFKDMRLSIKR